MTNPLTLLASTGLARTLTTLAVCMLPACIEKVPLAQDEDGSTQSDGGTSSDAPTDAPGDAPDRANTLAECFEIFPSGDGTATAHTNPLDFTFETTSPTFVKTAQIRYYNFCNDPDARVLSVELLGIDGAAPDPDFTITGAPEPGTMITGPTQGILAMRFAPQTVGTHRVIARLRMSHGYYETRFTGEVFAP